MIVSREVAGSSGPAVLRWKQILRRRRTLLIASIAMGLAVSLVGYLYAPARYVSEAVLALDVRKFQGLPSESVISPLPQENSVLRTELDIMHSRTMAAAVLKRLADEGVAVPLTGPERSLVQDVKNWLTLVVFPHAGAPAAPGEDKVQSELIDQLLDNTRVVNDGRSYTIFISHSAPSPDLAAAVANGFAQAYIDHQTDIQTNATQKVRQWLGEKVDGLRRAVETSEQARSDFRQKAGIVEFDGMTLQAHRVSALDGELVANRASLAGAQARLDTARRLAADPQGPAFQEILNSPTIQAFRVEQAKTARAIDQIENGGAIKSSLLSGLKSDLASINAQIAVETKRVIDGLANEVAIEQAKADSIDAALAQSRQAMSQADTALVKDAELEREATANREIYDSYLTRYKQTVEQEGITAPEARLISVAEPAASRASPSLSLSVLLGLALGGLTGIAAAVFLEITDRRIRSAGELEAAVGIPVIGQIISETRQSRASGTDPAVMAYDPAFAKLQAVLRSGLTTRSAQTIVFASAREGEGKTLSVVGLARSLAASGCKVIAVDVNMVAPTLAQALQLQPQKYLDELIRGKLPVETVIKSDREAGIDMIASRATRLPAELLIGTTTFTALMTELKIRYDYILFDTPATGQSSVAVQLASEADLTLLVVNMARTPVEDVERAVQLLGTGGRRPCGIVLTSFSRTIPQRGDGNGPGVKASGASAPVAKKRPSAAVAHA